MQDINISNENRKARTSGEQSLGWQQVNSEGSRTGMVQKICVATWRNELNVLKRLVEQETAIKSLRPNQSGYIPAVGFGPLHYACSLGNLDILSYLLDLNICDVNARDKAGYTPLMWVIRAGFDAKKTELLIDALFDHGVALNAQNYAGETALKIAAELGQLRTVEMLLENSAWTQVCDLEGASPLHYASAQGHVKVAHMLLRYGAHINHVDNEGDSPLHWAVRESKANIVQLLVKSGADIMLQNEDGENPQLLASCFGERSILEIFSQVRVVAPPMKFVDDLRRSDCGDFSMFPIESPTASIEKMEVEMKNLMILNSQTQESSRCFAMRSSTFGQTPPSVSFAT
eukprot:TRINITY_DN19838_c0_g1_i1.p1 TRINITY_DN19838_c0_g1~~TRINITY_DN19838_c0_g1_i1.p1  ORF type:complete len:345 (-),score=41.12 TRINITY_DN19838_c0_g1_i1:124-1158(-)